MPFVERCGADLKLLTGNRDDSVRIEIAARRLCDGDVGTNRIDKEFQALGAVGNAVNGLLGRLGDGRKKIVLARER